MIEPLIMSSWEGITTPASISSILVGVGVGVVGALGGVVGAGVGVGVSVGALVGVKDGANVPVGVLVGVKVGVKVPVGVGVGVFVGDGVPVAVGVGEGMANSKKHAGVGDGVGVISCAGAFSGAVGAICSSFNF